MDYKGKQVLITGGLGFIGSNLALRLVELGAKVAIVDSLEPGCGANPHNIEPIQGACTVIEADIGDEAVLRRVLENTEIVFNLAGEVSHIHSMLTPERDLAINTVAQLHFLRLCVRARPGIRIVYAGTRQVYGPALELPVSEDHPANPLDFNGIHKLAASSYHLLFRRLGLLDAVVLRLSNVYGPRMALGVSCQGVLSFFVRRAVMGEALEVFGEGRQLRDPLYVDDGVEAFLLAGAARELKRGDYNVGGAEPLSLRAIAEAIAAEWGCPVRERPFPEDRKQIEIGSIYTDTTRIRQDLGWRPQVRFAEGIRRTRAFYGEHGRYYLGEATGTASCPPAVHGAIERRWLDRAQHHEG